MKLVIFSNNKIGLLVKIKGTKSENYTIKCNYLYFLIKYSQHQPTSAPSENVLENPPPPLAEGTMTSSEVTGLLRIQTKGINGIFRPKINGILRPPPPSLTNGAS